MTITGPDEVAQVRVELMADWAEAPDEPPPHQPDRRRIGSVAGLVGTLAVLALVWWAARPESGHDAAADPIVAPTTTTATVATTTTGSTTTSTSVEPPMVVAQLDGIVTQVVRSSGVTLVVHDGPPLGFPSLLRSEGGLEFEDVADPFGAEQLLAIGAVEGGFAALTRDAQPPTSSGAVAERARVSTHFSPDGVSWATVDSHELTRPTIGVIDDTGWAAVGPAGIDAPDPEVSALLAEYVDANAADATCAMTNPPAVTEGQRFELYDCTGALVGEVWVSTRQAEAMWFAMEILRGPFAVTGADLGPVELPRGSFAITAIPTAGGPVVLLVDLYPVLRSTNFSYDAFRFSLARVDPSGEVETIAIPTVEGFDPQVLLRSLRGDLAFQWDDDLYTRPVDGSPEWRSYSAPRSGQSIGVTADGNDVVMIDRSARDVWVLDPDGNWLALRTQGRGVHSVLYVAADHALVLGDRGEVIRVPGPSNVAAATPIRRPLGEDSDRSGLVIAGRGEGEGFVGLTRTDSGVELLVDPVRGADSLATNLDDSFVARELRGDAQGLVVWGAAPGGDGTDAVFTSVNGRSWNRLELDLPDGIDRFSVAEVSRTEETTALLANVEPVGADGPLLMWQGITSGLPDVVVDRPCRAADPCAITSVLALSDGMLALHGSGGAEVEVSTWRPGEGWSRLPVEAPWAAGTEVLPRASAQLRRRVPGSRDPRGGATRPFMITDEWAGLLSIEDATIEKLWDAPVPGGRFDGVGTTGLVAAYRQPDSVHVYSDRSLRWTRYAVTGLVLEELLAVTSDGALYLSRSPDGPELVLFPADAAVLDR